MCSAEMEEVIREVKTYEDVTEAIINCENSVVFGCALSGFFPLDGRSVQDTQRLIRFRFSAGEKLVGGTWKACGHYRPLVTKKALFKG